MRVEFADFALDVRSRTLERSGQPVALEPAPSRLLVYLVRHRHRVVVKEEIRSLLWGPRIVGDSALTRCVSVLRAALGDRGGKRIVATIYGEGYRFVAPVRPIPSADTGSSLAEELAELEAHRTHPDGRARVVGCGEDSLFALAERHRRRGRFDAARAVLLQLARAARESRDLTLFVEALARHEMTFQIVLEAEPGSVRSLLLQSAVEKARRHPSLHARALACLVAARPSAPLASRERWAREALEATRAAESKERLEVLVHAHRALQTLGSLERREPLMKEAARLVSRCDDALFSQVVWRSRVAGAMERGDPDALEESLGRLGSLVAGEESDAAAAFSLASARCTLAALRGNYEDARLHQREAFEGLGSERRSEDIAFFESSLGFSTSFDRLEAGLNATRAPAAVRSHPLFPAVTASLLYDLRLVDAARESLRQVSTLQMREAPRDEMWSLSVAACASSAYRLDEPALAESAQQLLAPCTGLMVTGRGIFVGPVDYYLGMAAATLRDLARAEEHFAEAAIQARRLGARPWEASVLLEWGASVRRHGRSAERARAERLISRAVTIAESIEMKRVLERARHGLR